MSHEVLDAHGFSIFFPIQGISLRSYLYNTQLLWDTSVLPTKWGIQLRGVANCIAHSHNQGLHTPPNRPVRYLVYVHLSGIAFHLFHLERMLGSS